MSWTPDRRRETDWIPRARIILAQGPSIRFEPLRSVPPQGAQRRASLASLLDEFADLRAANLKLLRSWKITDRQLDLPGEHPRLGRVTLRQLLAAGFRTTWATWRRSRGSWPAVSRRSRPVGAVPAGCSRSRGARS